MLLDDISLDVLIEIIKCLPLKSVLQLSQVNKFLHDAIFNSANDVRVWKVLFMNTFEYDSPPTYSWRSMVIEYTNDAWKWNPLRKSEVMCLRDGRTAYLPSNFLGTYAAIQTTRGVSSGVHKFDIRFTYSSIESSKSTGNQFSVGVASLKFDMSNTYQGWTMSNLGIGLYEGKLIFKPKFLKLPDGQVFGLGTSRARATFPVTFPLELRMVINMDNHTIGFWWKEKCIGEYQGLSGTVYPTVMLMGRGRVVDATICKAIK